MSGQTVWEILTPNTLRQCQLQLEESGSVINYTVESSNDQSSDQLNRVLQGLGRRTKSHPGNKEICLAVMLQLDMKRIMSMEGP